MWATGEARKLKVFGLRIINPNSEHLLCLKRALGLYAADRWGFG